MDQGYKHFSHAHNLIMHQMPEGVEVVCSGCNSSGTGIVYVCWQCNFFLHEQCCRATRSLKHPSHPTHPLTLVPYPTYPSNSFYCNSCEIIGTGFTYSCADCEFDLHVQCAYSISGVATFQNPLHYPTNYFNPDQNVVPPSWNAAQNPYMAPSGHSVSIPNPITSEQYHVSIPSGHQNSITTAQDPFTTQNGPYVSQIPIAGVEYPCFAQAGPSVSIPTSSQNSVSIPTGSQIPIPGAQYPSLAQAGPSDSIPTSSQIPIPGAQYPSFAQPGPSVSIPTSSQNSVSIPTGSQIPIPGAQFPSLAQTGPSVSIPTSSHNSVSIPTGSQIPIPGVEYPSFAQDGPSVSIPTSSQNSVSIPTSNQNPVTSPQIQYPSLAQYAASVSLPTKNQDSITSTQNSNFPSISIPASSPGNQPDNHGQNRSKHFSHPHNLLIVNLQDKEDEIACSGCEETIIGKGYSCVEPKCDFHLHESCFHLKKEIQHNSHKQHPLTLLSLAPYDNENGEFTCNACFSDGTGFTYHCSICKFDLHIQCVSLAERFKRSDHEHMLKLFYSCPKGEECGFSCNICHEDVEKDRWAYYCESCDYCTHLGCVDCEECERDSVVDVQVQLQRLQLQMEMSRQQAQMMAGMGASLASLV